MSTPHVDRYFRQISGALVFVVMLLSSGIASAQTNLPAEHFYPRDPATGTLVVEHPETLEHLVISVASWVHWVDNPLILQIPPGIRGEDPIEVVLVDSALQADNTIAFGLWNRLNLSFSLPVIFYQRGEGVPELELSEQASTETTTGFGEPRIGLKIKALEAGPFGAAVEARVFLPSTARYRSPSPRFMPALITGLHFDRLRISTNVGWEFREAVELSTFSGDDRFFWAAGADFRVFSTVRLTANAFGTWDSGRDVGPALSSEFQGGFSVELAPGLTLNAAAGRGLSSGVGSPALRLIAGISYAPPLADPDNDGVPRDMDRCPDEPEDFDGFKDEDGCPDPDNDQDGIPDVDDLCPDLPEDFDGFEDEDGCPDPDNDQDGIADEEDECPNTPGVPELNGCPAMDSDDDGIPDHLDECPDEPEDFDGFEDEDGCPDPDNDQDGIPDEDDECPNEPETFNGFEDEDGCPDEAPSNIRLRGSRLEIGERVYFDTGSDRIQPRSYPILNELASVLRSQPDLTKIRISGHTDSRGGESMNLDLSRRRAASVRTYLIERGISEDRLTSRGFGESHPVDSNQTRSGREKNRRVEFHILERRSP